LGGGIKLDEKIKADSVPGDVRVLEIVCPVKCAFIVDQNLLGFQFHYPDAREYQAVEKSIKALVIKLLRDDGIELTERNNDIYFIRDGLEKKFFGMMTKEYPGWKATLFSLTMVFNSELANRIYRFDDEKFTKKGTITDISTIVGGLDEVARLDREKLVTSVVTQLAERYELEISNEQYGK
jgi:lipoate-protein ligase A